MKTTGEVLARGAAGPSVLVADLVRRDPEKGPTLVRLAWHSSGTYSKLARDGGSGPGTIRFKEELLQSVETGASYRARSVPRTSGGLASD